MSDLVMSDLVMRDKLLPQDWSLTEAPEPAARPWESVLARRTFRLTHPADPAQVLYCYTEKRMTVNRAAKWLRRVGSTAQANQALLSAWVPRDGWTDAEGRIEDLTATLRRIFREASARQKESRQKAA